MKRALRTELNAATQRQINESLTKQHQAYGPGSRLGCVGFIIDTWHMSLVDAETAYNYWANLIRPTL